MESIDHGGRAVRSWDLASHPAQVRSSSGFNDLCRSHCRFLGLLAVITAHGTVPSVVDNRLGVGHHFSCMASSDTEEEQRERMEREKKRLIQSRIYMVKKVCKLAAIQGSLTKSHNITYNPQTKLFPPRGNPQVLQTK